MRLAEAHQIKVDRGVRCAVYVCITEMDGLDAEYTDTDTDTDNRAGARLAGEGFELLPLH